MEKIELSLSEKLMHTTVRLECSSKNGEPYIGTGFFFSFKINDQQTIPVIITNKHVIEHSLTGTFVLTKQSDDGLPLIGSYEKITIHDFESRWIKHEDPNVDLAVFPIAPLLHKIKDRGFKIFYTELNESFIPTDEILAGLGGIEDITMIGYPNGLWDQENNLPIVRRGITATNPKHDYDGLPIFVIDCACFPGSSGSPVLIVNQGSYSNSSGHFFGGDRVLFLGVLYAGPQYESVGEVKLIDVPLQQVPISFFKIPNNLGFVIKSQKINDFRTILEDMNSR